MPDDLFDEFMEYDFTMGSDVVKCPHCGADVPVVCFSMTRSNARKAGRNLKKTIDVTTLSRLDFTWSFCEKD